MFGDLDHLSLQRFIEQERADDHLWMFLHIPKTAGSSFGNELARVRRPYRNIHVDYTDASVPVPQQMDRAIGRFISEMPTQQFLSCSGHFNVKQADAIAASNPKTKLISFLRHPVARVISDYRYARTPAHPPYRDFIARFPTFDAYLNSPGQNKMFRLLTGNPTMTVFDATAYIDRRYTFLGVLEMHPMSFNVMFRLFGENRMPALHTRRTEATEDNEVEVSPDLERKIRDANWKDMALYEHVCGRLSKRERAIGELCTRLTPRSGATPRCSQRHSPRCSPCRLPGRDRTWLGLNQKHAPRRRQAGSWTAPQEWFGRHACRIQLLALALVGRSRERQPSGTC